MNKLRSWMLLIPVTVIVAAACTSPAPTEQEAAAFGSLLLALLPLLAALASTSANGGNGSSFCFFVFCQFSPG